MITSDLRDATGKPVEGAGEALRRLRARLAGPSLASGEEGYEAARRVWNQMIDRRPALIAGCAGAGDVQRCVAFAREHGVALSVRGGGHNIGGRAVAEGGLMIDFSRRRRVRFDPAQRVAEVEPGATLGDVDRATQAAALAVPTGIVSETGIAGLALGGGFGWLSRRYGLTCDHLLSVELVTADGETLTVDAERHPDLFWALRGGGGGFGVVTSFRFSLQPLGPTITGGMLIHRGEQTAEVFDRFRRRTESSPEELGCLLKLGSAPPAPFLPEELHGRPVAVTIACHSGEPATAEGDLAPLRAGSPPVADLLAPRPFVEMQSLFDAGEPRGKRNYWKSEYVADLDDRVEAILTEHAGRLPSESANVKIFHLGGAVTRVPPGATAAGHRDARFIVVIATSWTDPGDDPANVGWVRDCWSALHAVSGRGGYVNFLTDDADAEQGRSSFGGVDLQRLAAVRRRYDPDGVLGAGRVEV